MAEIKISPPAGTNKYISFDPGPVTQMTGLAGVKFDFNYGARVQVPKGNYHVRFINKETNTVIYESDASDMVVASPLKYFINYQINLYLDGKLILSQGLALEHKKVCLLYMSYALGDNIAWIPYAQEFQQKHNCQVYCSIKSELADIFKPAYPELKFIKRAEIPKDCYATYYISLFYPADDRYHQPSDFRKLRMQGNIPSILGLKQVERQTVLKATSKERKIKEPYVCIAAQASGQAKYWNNPRGWWETVAYLKSLGYRVLCIDKNKWYGINRHWQIIPYGAEDWTGDIPLQERINLLAQADFFIGLPSGLAWLAWGIGIPVILISGFTMPDYEFSTPYRITNKNVCYGCWNAPGIVFNNKDFGWCPRQQNTPREYECTYNISVEQVCQTINQVIKDKHLKTSVEPSDAGLKQYLLSAEKKSVRHRVTDIR